MKSQNNKWVVRLDVPEEVYTDRHEFLDYFYKTALKAAHRRSMSTVLLGQRRMGKTEIFKRVVRKLSMKSLLLIFLQASYGAN
ncbi:MAG: hypothetical protein GY795_16365 [Desulfobacterales bacterium]|nr:hypothetical protein [Desulfobacterales bacterium]